VNLLVVLPVIARDTADKCIRSVAMEDSSAGFTRDEILVVDNSREGWAHEYGLRTYRDPDGHNLGVARSWNVGAREVLERGLDYLVILSASMLFGPKLHTTWVEQMERHPDADVIECDGHSWHLIALHRRCFEAVGLYDPAFYPAYFESIDFGRRLRLVGMETGWPNCWVNAMSMGYALHHEAIECPAPPLLDYYRQKWGGDKGEETFVLPFGDRPLDYIEEDPIPLLAERYGLGEYGTGWW
jgi:hypothetical protein